MRRENADTGQDFAWEWGGGGGGGAHKRLRHLIPIAAGVRTEKGVGYPPLVTFEKIGNLRQHFVRLEDSLLGNKAGKSEGH